MTGIEDLERCQQILQQHEWNIEVCVHILFWFLLGNGQGLGIIV
jgi:hypothetical protein